MIKNNPHVIQWIYQSHVSKALNSKGYEFGDNLENVVG